MSISVLLADILGPFLESWMHRLLYWTGVVFLKVASLGFIRLAPLTSRDLKGTSKGKKYEKSGMWYPCPKEGKVLKTAYTVVVGFLVWISAVIVGICFQLKAEAL